MCLFMVKDSFQIFGLSNNEYKTRGGWFMPRLRKKITKNVNFLCLIPPKSVIRRSGIEICRR